MLEKLLFQLNNVGNKKNVTIKNSISEEVKILGSPELLHKALLYIGENSIKFSEVGGEISISTFISEDNKLFNVSFQDAGPGLSVEARACLYDEFSVPDLLKHRQGLGISLIASRAIIEKHSGSISIDDDLKVGSKFTISLPINI